MELDAEFRKIYQNIIIALLSINNFTSNYYKTNENLRKIVLEFLDDPFYENFTKKKDFLKAVNAKNLNNCSDKEILRKANYLNSDTVNYLFYTRASLFSSLTTEEKKCLLFLDLCNHSSLSDIFFSKDIEFPLEDFYKVVKFVLYIKPKVFKAAMAEASKAGLVDFDESQNVLNIREVKKCRNIDYIETVVFRELERLSYIPSIRIFKLDDYEVSGNNAEQPLSEQNLITFTGECITSYIYSKLESEKIHIWYAPNIVECIRILRYFSDWELEDQYVWLDNYEDEDPYVERTLADTVLHLKAKLIVSGHNLNNPFAKDAIKISLKDSCFEKKIHKLFPEDLSDDILTCMAKIESISKKRDFLSSADSIEKDTDPDFFKKTPLEYFNLFDKNLEKDSLKLTNKKESTFTAIREEDFNLRYDICEADIEYNPILKAEYSKIIRIYKKLMIPATYLKADKQMFEDLYILINKHPNLLNKDLLTSFLKNAILLSKDSIIRIEPLLLVGNPGCGKSLFCRQLRELFKQDHDIFIPLGAGQGVDSIMGSTPDYKNASNGKILSSVWESMNNTNCLNSLIVLDELDKGCMYSSASDPNQNVLPVLLQLLGDENRRHFKDNYFDVPLNGFLPNFIATANSLENIPESLLDRFNIINFRDYTKEELVSNIIPSQYEVFKNSHNNLVPENLNQDEIEIIYEISKGKTRQIQTAINRYVAAIFDFEGQKHLLNSCELNSLLETSKLIWKPKQIGFCK